MMNAIRTTPGFIQVNRDEERCWALEEPEALQLYDALGVALGLDDMTAVSQTEATHWYDLYFALLEKQEHNTNAAFVAALEKKEIGMAKVLVAVEGVIDRGAWKYWDGHDGGGTAMIIVIDASGNQHDYALGRYVLAEYVDVVSTIEERHVAALERIAAVLEGSDGQSVQVHAQVEGIIFNKS